MKEGWSVSRSAGARSFSFSLLMIHCASAASFMTRDYISISEAAEYLKVSDRTVRRLIADGELTGYRIGKSGRLIRVDRNEIDQNLMRLMGGTVWRDTTPTTPQQT